MAQAEVLFGDYLFYKAHTANYKRMRAERPYLRQMKATSARLKLFESMAVWCSVRGLAAREWLCSLFVSRRWLYAPKLERAHLESEKHLRRFPDCADYRMLELRQRQAQPAGVGFDPNVDILPAVELLKQQFLKDGRAADCMAGMFSTTYGYHPRSGVCGRCPLAQSCAAQLCAGIPFDILALRRGELSSEAARTQALARVQSYGR